MAVGMLQMLHGVTKQQYDQVNEKMFGQSPPPTDQLPEGLVVHSAGPAENGWYVYDVWESREAFQRSWTRGCSRRSVKSSAISRRLQARSRSYSR